MDGYSRKDKDGRCEELSSEDRSLELRLGPPGEERFNKSSYADDHSNFFDNLYVRNQAWEQHHESNDLHLQRSQGGLIHVMGPQTSQPCDSRGPPLDMHCAEKKAAEHNGQKRIAPGPVVGWPPVRSFRKNLASGGPSKSPPPESERVVQNKELDAREPIESPASRNLLVKINMDGIAIGRKVDLKDCGSYDKLSQAVDKLFGGLLAAQNGTCNGIKDREEGGRAITGLLDGSGEYTLVYEDIEGDRMLVGDDVPWNVFVSTVKRLRVLRSSNIPTLSNARTKGKALP